MSEWRETTLGNLGTIFDGPHATPERINRGPYFLNISSLKDGHLDLVESDHVSEDDFVRWTRRVAPEAGDLLFSYETRLGEAALMPQGVRACLGRRMALIRPDRRVVDPRFLLYLYKSPDFRKTIERHTIHGATVNRISLRTMGSWTVRLPDLTVQRAIATVLSALDDKIAANARIAAVAESLALTLASRFAPSVPLGEVATRSSNAVDPTRLRDDRVLHYSLPAFDAGRVPATVDPQSIMSSKFTIPGPSVLVSKLNPRLPRVWNVARPGAGRALASTEYVVLTSDHCSPSVLWSLVAQPSFGAQLEGMVAGTSGSHQRVKPAEMLAVRIPDPRSIPDEEHRTIEGLALRAIAAREESQCLDALRDVLLPALMSGGRTVRSGDAVAGLADSGSITQPDVPLAGTLW